MIRHITNLLSAMRSKLDLSIIDDLIYNIKSIRVKRITKQSEELAQWVISNRYSRSENDKVSDYEMYHYILDECSKINDLPEWLNINEILPAPFIDVLVTDENAGEITIAFYNDEHEVFSASNVTHWQPLPEPIKK